LFSSSTRCSSSAAAIVIIMAASASAWEGGIAPTPLPLGRPAARAAPLLLLPPRCRWAARCRQTPRRARW
jgi:hypothetical protein